MDKFYDGYTNQDYTILLQMQIEELQSQLEKEILAHEKASKRATAAERRNSALRLMLEDIEGDIGILEQCWGCPDIGAHDRCAKCSNSAVMVKTDEGYLWRGKLRKR